MTTYDKRLERIKRNPKDVKFTDLVSILLHYGFVEVRSKGSHRIFKHPSWNGILTLQEIRGKAKPYQVRQAIKAIEEVKHENE
ncbi:toxin HicA [Dissulfuribacter thermophilus]|uniref:Toxin HicA n=1 Tax=Dissulfuribacter thermophilus TaxID=1156395 RepID=A0A1B9F9I3_9BACT|nr:type II toxin-antitoxin system HicA family toxin [Dissulfuribacter thermophilus]OCC16579.1 toxin HicA [Dissulfuribacter thermophilus]